MILNLAKKIIAEEIAEWVHLIKDDIRKLEEEKEHQGDESVIGFVTEIGGREELLDGEVIAGRKFGFSK